MPTEYEAKFLNIDVDSIKKKLKENGAKQVHGPLKFYRLIFKRCEEKGDNPGFVRVRNEGNKITMTTKIFNDKKFLAFTENCIQGNLFSFNTSTKNTSNL